MRRMLFASLLAGVMVVAANAQEIPAFDKTPFVRGDANRDGVINIADAFVVFSYLFNPLDVELYARVQTCEDGADANDDGRVDVADGLYILGYLYREGPPPPHPFPEAGQDLSDDDLSCYPWIFG